MAEQHGVASNKMNTGSHHRRCVDERRDRCWTFHRVRKPDVKWNLCRFPRCTDEQQQRDSRHGAECRLWGEWRKARCDALKVERAESYECEQDAQNERNVADAVYDERFLP